MRKCTHACRLSAASSSRSRVKASRRPKRLMCGCCSTKTIYTSAPGCGTVSPIGSSRTRCDGITGTLDVAGASRSPWTPSTTAGTGSSSRPIRWGRFVTRRSPASGTRMAIGTRSGMYGLPGSTAGGPSRWPSRSSRCGTRSVRIRCGGSTSSATSGGRTSSRF